MLNKCGYSVAALSFICVKSAFANRESSVRTVLFICCLFTNWCATFYRY